MSVVKHPEKDLTPKDPKGKNYGDIFVDPPTFSDVQGAMIGKTIQSKVKGAKTITTEKEHFSTDDSDEKVFEVKLFGDDVGDVILGKQSSGKYVQWDNSAGLLKIFGLVSPAPSFIAGRALTIGQSVAIGNGTDQFLEAKYESDDGTTETFDTDDWRAQTFTTSSRAVAISKIEIYGNRAGLAMNVIASIRAVSANVPTGADLESETVTVAGNSATGWLTLTFATPVPVSASTTYAMVLRGSSATESYNWRRTASNVYANGNIATSADTGSSWAADTAKDMRFRVYEIETEAGKIYPTTAAASGDLVNGYIGFASQTTAVGESCPVNISADDNQTGLTEGTTYYLSDTEGAIATSAGTVSKEAGLSLNSTTIKVKF